MDIEVGLRSPYACLELSYDKEDLVRFGMGVLELTTNVNTIEDVRREIYTAINVLFDSCLLISSYERGCVKMHDLVRDVALWVARKQGQAIVVARKEVPRMLVENETVKDTEVISLWDLEEDFSLSDQLQCPTLKILLLHSEDNFEAPYALYAGGMKALNVLALIRFCFEWDIDNGGSIVWAMPRSIELSINLRTLCLRGNCLGDISNLGNLKGLEILDLRGCSFNELPVGIVNMKKLKLLDLWRCLIEKSSNEVIGRCTQLQELIMCDQSKCPVNVSFPRLQRYALYVSFEDASMPFEEVLRDDAAQWLEKVEKEKEFEVSRALFIKGDTYSTLSSSLKDLIVRADSLLLRDCRWEGYRDEPFSMMKVLWLSKSPNIKILVDKSNVNIHQGQEEEPLKLNSDVSILNLFFLPELEYIWKGPAQILSLHRLEEVVIVNCSKLKTIFTPTVCTCLPNLMTLIVEECNELEEIISIDSEQLTNLPASASTSTSSNINVCFPKLSTISIGKCNKLKCLFSYSLASHCPSLTRLEIQNCCELEQVIGGVEGGGQEGGVLFPELKDLTLRRLSKLTNIFPGFEYNSLYHRIKDC